MLINTDENVTLIVKNEAVTNSSNQKLRGILFNNKFDFNEHFTSFCRKAFQKLNTLSCKSCAFLNLAQPTSIMNSFSFSQFGYRLLVWMLYSRKLTNCMNNIHERALGIVFRDNQSIFKQLLRQNGFVSIHQRNL